MRGLGGRFCRVVALSLILYLWSIVGIEWWALLIQWQMPLKGLAECLAPILFEELELAQQTTPPGPDFIAKQKGV